jgi:rfaE bifunctional protein nucleotidyltransferase chain/domain
MIYLKWIVALDKFIVMKVWVNGTFDVMHLGHIKLLEFASKYGEVRVGVDTDERVRSKKGEDRPYNSLSDRMEFLLSLKYVNSVVSFNTDEELMDRIQEWDSDIMVIGDDYKNRPIVGSHMFERIVFFNKLEGKSTTKILNNESSRNR